MSLQQFIHEQGIVTAKDIADRLGISQASVSRAISSAGLDIARLGKGPSSQYALYESIFGLPAQLPLIWIAADGKSTVFAHLHHLSGGKLYIEPAALEDGPKPKPFVFKPTPGARLPWWLSTLLLQGYLGRQRQVDLSSSQPSLSGDLATWSGTQHLYAHIVGKVDGRGAILLGEPAAGLWGESCATQGLVPDSVTTTYEALATQQLNSVLPGASSADGEQAKFIVRIQKTDAQGKAIPIECIVKFSPPRGTPFGERWHDLLSTEQVANDVLAANGFEVARSRLIKTDKRTFFESERLDRVEQCGRRHLLSFDVARQAFLTSGLLDWSDIARGLIRQRRLGPESQETVDALRAFGHLIGNNDMHNGNMSVFVNSPTAIWSGTLHLAPSYDMLCMRWAPRQGEAPDYTWFNPGPSIAGIEPRARQKALAMARDFWQRIAELRDVSKPLTETARTACKELANLL